MVKLKIKVRQKLEIRENDVLFFIFKLATTTFITESIIQTIWILQSVQVRSGLTIREDRKLNEDSEFHTKHIL